MPFPKKSEETPDKSQIKIYLTKDAKEQLNLLCRKMVINQSELIELLIRKTYTAQIEIANVQYIESREEILKKIVQDLHVMRGELDELKSR
ncbi:ribbon-helix-helix protein, CopG family [Sporomusa aerivorans]|uniref:ribbon-helix-helix protein, CopG family n=1 Tax=Sporomusa aerivorans TaxID=204936 RepID=UPI00352AA9E7